MLKRTCAIPPLLLVLCCGRPAAPGKSTASSPAVAASPGAPGLTNDPVSTTPQTEPERAAARFLEDAREGRLDAAYARMSQGYRGRTTRERFGQFVENSAIGRHKSVLSFRQQASEQTAHIQVELEVEQVCLDAPELPMIQGDGWMVDRIILSSNVVLPEPTPGPLRLFSRHSNRTPHPSGGGVELLVEFGVSGVKKPRARGAGYDYDFIADCELIDFQGRVAATDRYVAKGLVANQEPKVMPAYCEIRLTPDAPFGEYRLQARVIDRLTSNKAARFIQWFIYRE